MIAFVQDRFLPAAEATVSIHDRGFLYGDGLFETVRVAGARPLLWTRHLGRLAQGLAVLGIELPPAHSLESLHRTALELIRRNGLTDGVLRLAISRGPGARGYSPRGAGPPTVLLTVYPGPALDAPAPAPRTLVTSRFRVPEGDPLTPIKSASRLVNVLARREAEVAGADEALLLNTSGNLAEAGAANLFWFEAGSLHTPDLRAGALAGVTRGLVLEIARELGWNVREKTAGPDRLRAAQGAFLTFASVGLAEIGRIDDHLLPHDPRFADLREAYLQRIRQLP